MDKKEAQKRAKEIYLELLNLKTPNFSKNKNLNELEEKILEIDPHYAGLALTLSEGGHVALSDLYDVQQIKEQLNRIHLNNAEDEKNFELCKQYIDTVESLDTLLRIVASNNKNKL
jgi:hypothetical protein